MAVAVGALAMAATQAVVPSVVDGPAGLDAIAVGFTPLLLPGPVAAAVAMSLLVLVLPRPPHPALTATLGFVSYCLVTGIAFYQAGSLGGGWGFGPWFNVLLVAYLGLWVFPLLISILVGLVVRRL